MRKVFLIILVAAFSFAAWSPPSEAGPAWGNKKKFKHKGKYKVGPFGKMIVRGTGVSFWSPGGPPPWAPAHGYRRKMGTAYASPYGIGLGRCNRKEISGVLGGVAGGSIGSRIG